MKYENPAVKRSEKLNDFIGNPLDSLNFEYQTEQNINLMYFLILFNAFLNECILMYAFFAAVRG